MQVQVLVATMNQTEYSLLEKMNIQSDAIVGNQASIDVIKNFVWRGVYNIKWLTFNERGVGLNRNNALMRATCDYCLFADDDVVYVDRYLDIVLDAFKALPQADVIIFNIDGAVNRPNTKIFRVFYHNYLRYSTPSIAIKLKSIKENGIYFNQCFGGGTEHSHGEDTLFLTACLNKGLKIYAVPDYIAKLRQECESTWFKTYDEKYLKDQGCLYKTISRRWWRLLCLQDALRRYKLYNKSWHYAYKLMVKGALSS